MELARDAQRAFHAERSLTKSAYFYVHYYARPEVRRKWSETVSWLCVRVGCPTVCRPVPAADPAFEAIIPCSRARVKTLEWWLGVSPGPAV